MGLLGKFNALLTRPERKTALVLLALMVVGMVLETLGIGLVIPAIGLLMQSDLTVRYPALQPVFSRLGNPVRVVEAGMLFLVSIYFVKAVFLGFLAWKQTKFAFAVQEELSHRLFTTYLRQPYTFHLQRNSAQLIQTAVNEVTQFTFSAILPGLLVATESLVVIGIAALLLFIEPLGASIVVVTLGGAAWGFQYFTRGRITQWGEARQFHEGLRIQHLQQGLAAAKDVKLLGRETDFLEQYREHNEQSARVGRLSLTLGQLPRLWLELLAVAGLAILVIVMLSRGKTMDRIVPALALFAAAAFRLMPSVNKVLVSVQSLRYGLPVINTLYEELKITIPKRAEELVPRPFRDLIELSSITYCYPSGPAPAVKRVSLNVKRGESVGIIGRSGSGKSTLVDLFLGLLTPDAGHVIVDGVDIQQNIRGWQDQIGYVPQSIFLTDDTLRRNIAFGLADQRIDDELVRRAVRSAQLEEFVGTLPDGLKTRVGERGIRLSGGQRQRIGIARALYHDPTVLVLDEATSSLDTAAERGIMEAVTAFHGEKTVLIVAHRLSTVELCDRIYKVEKGAIVAEGVPQDILRIPQAI